MPQTLALLLSEIATTVAGTPERKSCHADALSTAVSIAPRMPVIHRSGRTASPPWLEILKDERIQAKEVRTDCEKQQGYSCAVYCSWGYGAFPHGHIAFLMSPITLTTMAGTATPFDTGGCSLNHFGHPAVDMTDPLAVCAYVDRYTLPSLNVLAQFGAEYLAAHFRDPLSYLTMPQFSMPDFTPYHGLISATADRRCWTIELQVHEDIPLFADPDQLRIVLDDRDLVRELPSNYASVASYPIRSADLTSDPTDSFATAIADRAREFVLGAAS